MSDFFYIQYIIYFPIVNTLLLQYLKCWLLSAYRWPITLRRVFYKFNTSDVGKVIDYCFKTRSDLKARNSFKSIVLLFKVL